jgi:3-deoxy-7-phosphoheptulonate synthase
VEIDSEKNNIDIDLAKSFGVVERIFDANSSIFTPKYANYASNFSVNVCSTKFGGGNFSIIAGPCAVESEEQITKIAFSIKKSGASMLRGGAFKPRTSPYEFQGLGKNGIKMLARAGRLSGLPSSRRGYVSVAA